METIIPAYNLRKIGTNSNDRWERLMKKYKRGKEQNQQKKEKARERRKIIAEKRKEALFNGIKSMQRYFNNDNVCLSFLEAIRWNGKPHCPSCGLADFKTNEDNPYTYICLTPECQRKPFSVTDGTLFENRKLSYLELLEAMMYDLLTTLGLTTSELSGYMEISPNTSYKLLCDICNTSYDYRIFPLDRTITGTGLLIYEVDIIFVDDGENQNRHIEDKRSKKEISYRKLKAITINLRNGPAWVIPLVDKDGKPLKTIKRKHIKYILLQYISPDAYLICCDGDVLFAFLADYFPDAYFTVLHKDRYSVLGIVHVNGAECVHRHVQACNRKGFERTTNEKRHMRINSTLFRINTNALNLVPYEKLCVMLFNMFRTVEEELQKMNVYDFLERL